MFRDDDLRSVMAATQALIATKVEGYPPTIGAIKEKLYMIRTPSELTEQEAWKMVSKACRNGYYNYVEEFEKLPEVIQRSLGGAEQLRTWSQMDTETFESVVASNFMRTFRVKKQQQKENLYLLQYRNLLILKGLHVLLQVFLLARYPYEHA